jgi:hypothetical protein
MAKPRVFISSTFYDLRQIRVELDKFIESLGFEPVRNEEGDIPYGKEDALQSYCYKEISNIDILVSVIGSRYGSKGDAKEKEQEYSVSQMELKTALKEDKQVFIFIDKNVFTEYETYLLNKGNEDVNYKYVDNPNIYKFIEEIKSLPNNNNIKGFETAEDITCYLKEQFAGLFKQFMLDSKRIKEALVIRDIESTAKTLREMVDYLKDENQGKDEEINQIIKVNHPIVSRLKEILGIQYNIYIEGKSDLLKLLKSRGYEYEFLEDVWERKYKDSIVKLTISDGLFEKDGKLRYMKAADWRDDFISIQKSVIKKDDDLPF